MLGPNHTANLGYSHLSSKVPTIQPHAVGLPACNQHTIAGSVNTSHTMHASRLHPSQHWVSDKMMEVGVRVLQQLEAKRAMAHCIYD